MKSLMLLKLWRDLKQRPLSLSALVLVAAIGVACFVGMFSVIADLLRARDTYYQEYRLADFWVDVKRAPTWTVDRLARIAQLHDVEGRVYLPVRVRLADTLEPVTGLAISIPEQGRPRLIDLRLTTGTWPDPHHNEALVIDAFARARRLRPGDSLTVVLLDEVKTFVISGLAMSPEFVYVSAPGGGFVPDPARSPVIYLPQRLLQESGDLDGAFNQVIGRVRGPLGPTLTQVEEALDPYGVTYSTPADEQSSVRFLENELHELRTSATIVPLICLGVVAFVLNVVLRRIVAQQQMVIGTLRALGYSQWFLLRHYASYALAIGLAAGLLGIGGGVWMEHVLLAQYAHFFALPGMTASLHGTILLQGLAVAVIFSLAGAISAVRFAVRLEPAVAMRPLPPEKGGRVLLERIPLIWRWLPFRWKMIVRSIFRSPFRSLVTLGTTIVATALMVETLSMVSALDYMIDYEFVRTSRQDITIGLRDPVGTAGHELERLPAVEGVELQLGVACDLTNGPWRKRVSVSGLPPAPTLYTPLDDHLRPIPIPDEGLVLSRKLADVLHVQPGMRLSFRPLIGERRVTDAAVVSIVDTYIGLAAYADARYLSRLIGEDDVANAALARVRPGAPTEDLLRALDERPAVLSVERRMRTLERIHETIGRTLGTSLLILLGFAGLLGFGGVVNTALVSLNERLREVGTLRVLGYSSLDVQRIFSGESLLLNLAGVTLGVFAGVGLVHIVSSAYDTELFRLPAVVTTYDLALAAGLTSLFILLAQVVVYFVVTHTDWLAVFKVRE